MYVAEKAPEMGAYCIRLDTRKVLVKVQPYTPNASVTQLAERWVDNPEVDGSSPSAATLGSSASRMLMDRPLGYEPRSGGSIPFETTILGGVA